MTLLILDGFLDLHHNVEHLVLKTLSSDSEIEHCDLHTDLRGVVWARQFRSHVEAEVGVIVNDFVTELELARRTRFDEFLLQDRFKELVDDLSDILEKYRNA